MPVKTIYVVHNDDTLVAYFNTSPSLVLGFEATVEDLFNSYSGELGRDGFEVFKPKIVKALIQAMLEFECKLPFKESREKILKEICKSHPDVAAQMLVSRKTELQEALELVFNKLLDAYDFEPEVVEHVYYVQVTCEVKINRIHYKGDKPVNLGDYIHYELNQGEWEVLEQSYEIMNHEEF